MTVALKHVALGAALIGALAAIVWIGNPNERRDTEDNEPSDTAISVSKLRAGMSYAEARKILVDSGWQPLPLQTTERRDCLNLSEVCAKYIEAEDCSKTDIGYCRFLFSDTAGTNLTVVTAGEDAERLSIYKWIIEEPEGIMSP